MPALRKIMGDVAVNMHKPMTEQQAAAIYAGLVPQSDTIGDPFQKAARLKMEAMRDLPKITKLMNALIDYQGFVLSRATTGRLYSNEDNLRLAILEGIADLEGIDTGNTLPDLIQSLRFDLGRGEP
jgi:hypothetical protein